MDAKSRSFKKLMAESEEVVGQLYRSIPAERWEGFGMAVEEIGQLVMQTDGRQLRSEVIRWLDEHLQFSRTRKTYSISPKLQEWLDWYHRRN